MSDDGSGTIQEAILRRVLAIPPGYVRWVWARLAVRVVLGAPLLFVVLIPLLAQEGEPSTGTTVYGYVAMTLVLLGVGTSIYRLLRRNGVGKRRAGIVGLVAAPATYVTCALAYVLITRVA